jgi:hypothetical protein
MAGNARLDDPEQRTAWREALARKYPGQDEARLFVDRAGLDATRIAFHARADLTWFSILDEARKQGAAMVQAVLGQALRDYPEDEALKRLHDGADTRYAAGPDLTDWRGGRGSLEKVLGMASALVPVSFLERGLKAAQAVTRIKCADFSFGSGFLVEDDLLVTNWHVLPDRDAAAGAWVQFNCQTTLDGRDAPIEELRLDPDRFVTSKDDDFTVVKIQGSPRQRWTPLPLAPVQLAVDDRVNIIQHPGGGSKQLSFFHNMVVYVGQGRVQYLTDTLPGSSGAPVFDRDWRVVALHHSGGWLTEPGSKRAVYRNEGIHIDRIIAAIATWR